MTWELGRVLRDHRDEILENWLRRVSSRPQASGLPRETVMNNIPALVDEMIQALEQPLAKEAVVAISREIAAKHGDSRLALGYGLEELGQEYNSLREALLDTLRHAKRPLDEATMRALHLAVDQAHRVGVERFIEAQQEQIRRRQSDFLARLSHDFRSPLTTIVTSVDLLQRTMPAGAAVPTRHLERIRTAAGWLLRLVEGQLVTEQAMSGTLQPRSEELKVAAVVGEIVEMMRPRAEAKGLKLYNRVPDELSIRTDALLLGQVVQNLLENGIKYTDQGSISISAASDVASVRLVVEDTGRGIAPDVLPVIFDMYQRWEHASPGHGIGLASVKLIVTALGGSIHVDSELGKGSCFTITLPKAHPMK